jgi:hypothetical protein
MSRNMLAHALSYEWLELENCVDNSRSNESSHHKDQRTHHPLRESTPSHNMAGRLTRFHRPHPLRLHGIRLRRWRWRIADIRRVAADVPVRYQRPAGRAVMQRRRTLHLQDVVASVAEGRG